jgi:hypothetical protein
MIAAIKQHAVVKKGGIIEIFVPDFDEDSEIEVEGELTLHVAERDDTAYLEASPETHRQIVEAMRNAEEHPENLIVFTPGEWNAQYRL